MPDDRWPGIVEHPLDYACGRVLVSAVCLEHGANAFIAHELRLEGEVGGTGRPTVACILGLGVHLNVFEFAATRVEIPIFVNRPQMVFREHRLQTLYRGDRRAWTGFGVEAVRSTASAGVAVMRVGTSILGPIAGGDVLIRAGHFDPAFASHRGRLRGR